VQTTLRSAEARSESQGERTARPAVLPAPPRARCLPPAGFEVALSVVGIALTIAFSYFALGERAQILTDAASLGETRRVAEQILQTLIVAAFIFGGLVFQIARLGCFSRARDHQRSLGSDPRVRASSEAAPAVTLLVPSYKEDAAVVRRTLLSAALQAHPNLAIVLLIDDPPAPSDIGDQIRLQAARMLPGEIAGHLAGPASDCRAAFESFRARSESANVDVFEEMMRLAALHRRIAQSIRELAAGYPIREPADTFFVERVVRSAARSHLRSAFEIEQWGARGVSLSVEDLFARYQHEVACFSKTVSSFERKRYWNLSHEPNKAMNLNAYIGLLGSSYCEARWGRHLLLKPADASEPGSVSFRRPDYLVTLDADSVLLPGYLERLIRVMERDPSVAVAQTPYSAFPMASSVLERIASATTDIQYIVHQGFTQFGATFWVGANAVLRMSALEDIARESIERGFSVRRFIQDRTVIEDTESSIDLSMKGWKLYNFPERLSYSATPPDFGSLVIQRSRWANGGLIILPKLLRYAFALRGPRAALFELVMRFHYLVSIALVNLGLLIVLMWSFGASIRSAWLPLTALPYYGLYFWDMQRLGYRPLDFVRVYVLNLLLVPVNLEGVCRSLHQGLTGKKSAFRRTPKIENRTTTGPVYIVLEYLLAAHCIFGAFMEFYFQRPVHAAFALINGLLWIYGIASLIGFKATFDDLKAWLRTMSEGATASSEPDAQAELARGKAA
jgi:cellulose synthase/poly-beta-1,6-N-acetylglucosamine synthase-like glycosyltransferase